jgi:hypothetical protein
VEKERRWPADFRHTPCEEDQRPETQKISTARIEEDQIMGFLPFVNQGGQRVVRWHRLALVWLFILSATMFGSCLMGYVLVGDWRYGVFAGMATGVAFSTVVTYLGFTAPVEKLPRP